jgi:hypothetical protein
MKLIDKNLLDEILADYMAKLAYFMRMADV